MADRCYHAFFSPDNTRFLAVDLAFNIKIFDTETGKILIQRSNTHTGNIR